MFKSQVCFAALACLIVAVSAQPMMSPWAQYGRDSMHTGRSNVSGPVSALTGVKWIYNTTYDIECAPVIDIAGNVYFGNENNMFFAVSATGAALWNFSTYGTVSASAALGMDGTVYVGTENGVLYAINSATGMAKWNYTASSSSIKSGVAIGPDNTVYYGSSDDVLYAVDGATGAPKWNFTGDNSFVIAPAVAYGMVYIGTDSSDGNFYALNATTGAQVWNHSIGSYVEGPASVYNNMVYIGGYYGDVSCLNAMTGVPVWNTTLYGKVAGFAIGATGTVYASASYYLYAINGMTGSQMWNWTVYSTLTAPVLGADGTAYVGSTSYHVHAINGMTGAQLWNFTTASGVYAPGAIGADGTLYFGSDDNRMYAFSAVAVTMAPTSSPTPAPTYAPFPTPAPYSSWSMFGHDAMHTGRSMYSGPTTSMGVKWRFSASSSLVLTAVTGSDGTIYVSSLDNRVYALNPNTGARIWNFSCTDDAAAPLVGPDGTVYFGSDDSQFRAVNGATGALKWNFSYSTSSISSSPVIDENGVIYYGSDDSSLYAVNSTDGSLKWKFTAYSSVGYAAAIGAEGMIYFTSSNYVYGLYANGTQRWRVSPSFYSCSNSPSVGMDGTVYIACYSTMYALNGATGAIRWNWTTSGTIYGSPALSPMTATNDQVIYFGTTYSKFFALSAQTGASMWNYSVPFSDYVYTSPVLGADGSVYFSTDTGRVYSLSSTGHVQNFTSASYTSSGTAIAMGSNGDLYVLGSSYLTCVSASFGPTSSPTWSPTPAPAPTPAPGPTPGPNCNYTNCSDCNSHSACGWCSSTMECRAGTSSGPSDGSCTSSNWYWTGCPSITCSSYTNCFQCAATSCSWCSTSNTCSYYGSACSASAYAWNVLQCPSLPPTGLTAGTVTAMVNSGMFSTSMNITWSGFTGDISQYGLALGMYNNPSDPTDVTYLTSMFFPASTTSYTLSYFFATGYAYQVYLAAFNAAFTSEALATTTVYIGGNCNATGCFGCSTTPGCYWCGSSNTCMPGSTYYTPVSSMCANTATAAYNPLQCPAAPQGNLTTGMATVSLDTYVTVAFSGFGGDIWGYGLALEVLLPYANSFAYVTAGFVNAVPGMSNYTYYFPVGRFTAGTAYRVYVAAFSTDYANEAVITVMAVDHVNCSSSNCYTCSEMPGCAWCGATSMCTERFYIYSTCNASSSIVDRAIDCPLLPSGSLTAGSITVGGFSANNDNLTFSFSGFGGNIAMYGISLQVLDASGELRSLTAKFMAGVSMTTYYNYFNYTYAPGMTYVIVVAAFDADFTMEVVTTSSVTVPSPCAASNCFQCSIQLGCGWCATTQTCSNGNAFGPSSATCSATGWIYDSYVCPARPAGNLMSGNISSFVLDRDSASVSWTGFSNAAYVVVSILSSAFSSENVVTLAAVPLAGTTKSYTFQNLNLNGGLQYSAMVTAFDSTMAFSVSATATATRPSYCRYIDECFGCAYQSGCGWCSSSNMCMDTANMSTCAAASWINRVDYCPSPPQGPLVAGTVTVTQSTYAAVGVSWTGFTGAPIYLYGLTLLAWNANGTSSLISSGYTSSFGTSFTFSNLVLTPGTPYRVYVNAFTLNYVNMVKSYASFTLMTSVVPVATTGNTTVSFTNPNSTASASSLSTNSMLVIPSGAVPAGARAALTLVDATTFSNPANSYANPMNFTRANYAGVSFAINIQTSAGAPVTTLTAPISVSVSVTNPAGSPMLYLYNTSSGMWEDATMTCAALNMVMSSYDGSTLTVNVCHLTQFAVFAFSSSSSKNESYKWIVPLVILLVAAVVGGVVFWKYQQNKKARYNNNEGETYYTQLLPTSGGASNETSL